MSREALARAADHVTAAAESADGETNSDRLTDLADRLDDLATADRGPDHGRLARMENGLHEAADGAGEDVTAAVDDALEAIHDHRETLEGV